MATLKTFFSKLSVRSSSHEVPIRSNDVAVRFHGIENMMNKGGSAKLLRVIRSFSPSHPTHDTSQFAGRSDLLNQVIAAIEEHQNHVVLFGVRGSGKTSLAMALMSSAHQVGYHCSYISCSRESSIQSIFRSALANLSIRYDKYFDPRIATEESISNFGELLSVESSPQDLIDLLSRISGKRLLIIIDEFDRNESRALTRDLTEIMKALSDRDIPVQVVIVGVGDVVDSLVGEHASIARVLYVVKLDRMTEVEINDVIATAAHLAEVEFSIEVLPMIVAVAHGRPHIARLIGLKAAKAALQRGALQVERVDFDVGCDELLGHLDMTGFESARRQIDSESPNFELLRAILRCSRDSSDNFTIADIQVSMLNNQVNIPITEIEREVEKISKPKYSLLEASDGLVRKYRFADPRAEICASIICGRAPQGQRIIGLTNEL